MIIEKNFRKEVFSFIQCMTYVTVGDKFNINLRF